MQKLKKSTDRLLERDDFRNAVFARDKHTCVICGKPGQDAHHILERRLFSDGGYYLSNGSTLCGQCHILAEQTTLTVEQIRIACGIEAPALPEHFYPDEQYDKWGNIVLPTGMRTKGELFNDESVQKILKEGGFLNERVFGDYVKYPRTLHFPWSPGATEDDRIHKSLAGFEGQEVVETIKMDGENTNFYNDYFHTRSLDSESHPSQSWARKFHSEIKYDIPKGWRICCENLYAKHSISYNNLKHFVQVFSIWNDSNTCLSWSDTLEYCALLNLTTVPVIYVGPWDEPRIRDNIPKQFEGNECEGVVVRVSRSFQFAEFRKVVGKYVRAGHVQTTHHWKRQMLTPNSVVGKP